jgi:uncharacterized protein (TIGR03083 family)
VGTGTVNGDGGHLDLLERATERFAAVVREASGDEPVPACGPWTLRDLVVHVGTVHRWAASIVLSGQRLPPPAEPLVVGAVGDWYAGTAQALVAALRSVDPDEVVPNFSRVGETAAFWPRRQLHEVTVHTVDALQALGRDEAGWAVPADLAADGVDEVLRVFFPRMTERGAFPDVRTRLHLQATDVGRSWVVAPGEGDGPPAIVPWTAGTPTARATDAPPAEAVAGTASDLYLALWHRVPPERLRVDGEGGVALLAGPTTP